MGSRNVEDIPQEKEKNVPEAAAAATKREEKIGNLIGDGVTVVIVEHGALRIGRRGKGKLNTGGGEKKKGEKKN